MAKISESRIDLLRPDFGDSNQLMNEGLKSLLESFKPVQTQMDANFAERESNATGSLLEQISQGMPQDYNNNPEARALFDSQISQYANSAGLAKEGVNLQDVYTALNEVGKTRDANRSTYLGNQTTELANTTAIHKQAMGQYMNMLANGTPIAQVRKHAVETGNTIALQAVQNEIETGTLNNANLRLAPTMEAQNRASNFEVGDASNTLKDFLTDTSNNYFKDSLRGGKNTEGKSQGYQQGSYGTNSSGGITGGNTHGLTANTLSYSPLAAKYGETHGVSPNLVTAMIGAESSGKAGATSGKNAKGLMQVVPKTWEYLTNGNGADPSNPEDSINYGTKYIKEHLDKYSKYGDKALSYALMAYNWGEGRVDKLIARGGKINADNVPKETLDYLKRVQGNLDGLAGVETKPNMQIDNTDRIKYSNTGKGTTRSLPASTKVSNVLNSVGSQMGLTFDVHSGGEDATTGYIGNSRRHEHGDAVDIDVYKDGKKLSFKNAKDVPILQEFVKLSKAKGFTGFGAGEGYMGGDRIHAGFGKSAVWGAPKGGSPYKALTEAFNSDVSGYSNPDELMQDYQKPLLTMEDLVGFDNIKQSGRTNSINTFNKLSEEISDNLPDPINSVYGTDYYSQEKASNRNSRLVDIEEERLDNKQQGYQDLISESENIGNSILNNRQKAEDAEAALARLSGGQDGDNVPISSLVDNKDEMIGWLGESGITKEMFSKYPMSYQIQLIEEQRKVEQSRSSNSREKVYAVEKFGNRLLDSDASFTESAISVIDNRDLDRKEKNSDKLKDGWVFKSEYNQYADKRRKFEMSIAGYIDKAIADDKKNTNNKRSFAIDGYTSKLLIGNGFKDVGFLLDSAIKEYDRLIIKDYPKETNYLSKNLKGNNIFINEEVMRKATLKAALNHAEGVRKNLDKESQDIRTEKRITARDVLGNIAANELQKSK